MPGQKRTWELQPTQRATPNAALLAVHWTRVDDVLAQAGTLSGKVLVTCSLPMSEDNTHMVIGHTTSGAEALARMWYPRSVPFPARCCFQSSSDAEKDRCPI